MASEGDNLAAVLRACLDVIHGGSLDTLASVLDEEVAWYGVVPGTGCANRRQLLDMLARREGGAPRLTRLEVAEIGDTVVATAAGPDFRDPATGEPRPEATLVITLRDGRVVEIRGMRTREEALAAVVKPM